MSIISVGERVRGDYRNSETVKGFCRNEFLLGYWTDDQQGCLVQV